MTGTLHDVLPSHSTISVISKVISTTIILKVILKHGIVVESFHQWHEAVLCKSFLAADSHV